MSFAADKVVVVPLGVTKTVTLPNFSGSWVTSTSYSVGQTVELDGSTYVCLTTHTSDATNTPPNVTYWSLIAAKSDQGIQGEQGRDGLNCWDLNGNGNCDVETEDINKNETCDAQDCQGSAEVILELCNLYELTTNPLPLICRNCGNGILEPFEQCDDSNTDEGDGCADCLLEICGNGILNVGEECDDGNLADGDGCTSSCTIIFRKVFVTSTSYQGNLGGLVGADALCNELATTAELSGTYKAWLSDDSNSPSTRFTHHGQFILVDGTLIAESWNDLTDGFLKSPIYIDESGATASNPDYVWTGTTGVGEIEGLGNCTNWTNNKSESFSGWGLYGDLNQGVNSTGEETPGGWSLAIDTIDISNPEPLGCNNTYRLYCFEQ